MKKISTKNLYLCELRQILNEDYDILTTNHTVYFTDEIKYIYANKFTPGIYDKFTDVFTRSVHSKWNAAGLSSGDWCVRRCTPVITDFKYVSLDILAQSLKELNPTFFEPKVEKKNIKQRILNK